MLSCDKHIREMSPNIGDKAKREEGERRVGVWSMGADIVARCIKVRRRGVGLTRGKLLW